MNRGNRRGSLFYGMQPALFIYGGHLFIAAFPGDFSCSARFCVIACGQIQRQVISIVQIHIDTLIVQYESVRY